MLLRFQFLGARLRVVVFALVVTITSTAPAVADFVLTTTTGIRRYSDAGMLVFSRDFGGEGVGGLTLGSNGIIYSASNEFGIAEVLRNYLNGAFVDPQPGIGMPTNFFTGGYRGGKLEFGPHGDLFALSFGDLVPNTYPGQRVLRINGSTGAVGPALDGAIPPFPVGPQAPTSFFADFDSRGDELFVANIDGTVQRHLITANDETLVDTFDTGLSGVRWITFGPDGLLYLREEVNNSIVRYNVDTKMVVDTFVSSVPLTNSASNTPPQFFSLGDIFFGPAGDLFAINPSFPANNLGKYPNGYLVRFNGQTGAYLGPQLTLPPLDIGGRVPGLGSFGFYTAVPEPATLISVGWACAMIVGGLRLRTRRDVR